MDRRSDFLLMELLAFVEFKKRRGGNGRFQESPVPPTWACFIVWNPCSSGFFLIKRFRSLDFSLNFFL